MNPKIFTEIKSIQVSPKEKILIGWANFPANNGILELAFRYEYLDEGNKIARMSPITPLRLLSTINLLANSLLISSLALKGK